jgi:hypothetical protein
MAQPCKRQRVIIAKGEGQLGNRLFQAASFLAASYERGFEVWNPAFGEYADFFPAISGDILCRPEKNLGWILSRRMICRAFACATRKYGEALVKGMGGVVLDISKSHDSGDSEYDLCGEHFAELVKWRRFVLAKGWKFRAHTALSKHREKITQVFQTTFSIDEEVRRSVSAARNGVDLLVGVHVRLGDYATWQGGRYYFEIGEYKQWMRKVAEMNPGQRVGFLVCSNCDVEVLVNSTDLRVARGPGSAVADLYALAACDRLIGPPSTFSLWASYFGAVPLHMLETAGQDLWQGGFVRHERV